jgi:hypothetical protein
MADQEFTAGELRPPKALKSSVTVMVYNRNACLARVMRRLGVLLRKVKVIGSRLIQNTKSGSGLRVIITSYGCVLVIECDSHDV